MSDLILVKEEDILELPEDKFYSPAQEIVKDDSLCGNMGLIGNEDMDILIVIIIPFTNQTHVATIDFSSSK